MPKQPRHNADSSTAWHEAGHAVATVIHGLAVEEVSVIGETLPDGRPELGFNDILSDSGVRPSSELLRHVVTRNSV